MSKKIALITDSCADVPTRLKEQYHIYVLPMSIMTKDGLFKDGVDIHSQDIYQRLEDGELPKTSLPLGEDILGTFKQIKRDGYDQAIAIILSSGLSGSFNQIRLLASEEELEIEVFDSKQASMGIGLIVLQIAKEIEAGLCFEEAKQRVDFLIKNTYAFFSIDNLELLEKGGRIGKATAVLGTALKIKPILSFDLDGEIYTAAKVRGNKGVPKKLISLVHNCLQEGHRYNLAIVDGGATQRRELLKLSLNESLSDYDQMFESSIGSALSVYLGSGLLGIAIQILD